MASSRSSVLRGGYLLYPAQWADSGRSIYEREDTHHCCEEHIGIQDLKQGEVLGIGFEIDGGTNICVYNSNNNCSINIYSSKTNDLIYCILFIENYLPSVTRHNRCHGLAEPPLDGVGLLYTGTIPYLVQINWMSSINIGRK